MRGSTKIKSLRQGSGTEGRSLPVITGPGCAKGSARSSRLHAEVREQQTPAAVDPSQLSEGDQTVRAYVDVGVGDQRDMRRQIVLETAPQTETTGQIERLRSSPLPP